MAAPAPAPGPPPIALPARKHILEIGYARYVDYDYGDFATAVSRQYCCGSILRYKQSKTILISVKSGLYWACAVSKGFRLKANMKTTASVFWSTSASKYHLPHPESQGLLER